MSLSNILKSKVATSYPVSKKDKLVKTHKVRLYPNAKMKVVLDNLCDYNRYCYNKGLETWNDMYNESVVMGDKKLRPNEYKVRNELVANKEDWQYQYSARVLQQAINRLNRAWSYFFNPRMKRNFRPKFKSKRSNKQSFSSDRITIVNDHYLKLDRPREATESFDLIKMSENLRFNGEIKLVTITKCRDKYFASIAVQTDSQQSINKVKATTGVDMNIKHIDWDKGSINTLTDRMIFLQSRITAYQRQLARKRVVNSTHFRSHNYNKIQAKLNRDYLKIYNLQQDLIQKTTHDLVVNYDSIGIEDLDVEAMKMNKHLAKNIQRGLFGRFKEVLTYKASWNGINLVKVDRFYPSTQRCSECGFVKTKDTLGGKQTLGGDSIHRDHQTYYCYNCGAILDRDKNAVANLTQYTARLIA